MPVGQTPHTMVVFAHGDLVDKVQPGDRITITGAFIPLLPSILHLPPFILHLLFFFFLHSPFAPSIFLSSSFPSFLLPSLFLPPSPTSPLSFLFLPSPHSSFPSLPSSFPLFLLSFFILLLSLFFFFLFLSSFFSFFPFPGIYRASPLRINPRQRNVLAVYKTHFDVVHYRKLDHKRLHELSPGDDDDAGDG